MTAAPYRTQSGKQAFSTSEILYFPAANAIATEGELVGASIAAVAPA